MTMNVIFYELIDDNVDNKNKNLTRRKQKKNQDKMFNLILTFNIKIVLHKYMYDTKIVLHNYI